MPPAIPPEEVEFHKLSYVDENVRLFWWRGGLYRGIKQGDAAFYRNLVESDLFKNLMMKGLVVGTEIADLAHPDFAMILKHDVLPVVSYPYEWTFGALKDAALLALTLQEILTKNGLYLNDPHPWNILFDGTRPVFVDIGAIGPMPSPYWMISDSISQYYRNPLRLMAAGHPRIAHALMRNADHQGVFDEEAYDVTGGHAGERLKDKMFSLLRSGLPLKFRQRVRNSLASVPVMSPGARLKAARRQISQLALRHIETRWSDYRGHTMPTFSSQEGWSAKQRSVSFILQQARPKSVLDIGCNKGWYSELAARQGARVAAFDANDSCADTLYRRAKEGGLNIQPLVMNLVAPPGSDGVQDAMYPPAAQRLRSEFVMALGLLHHIVFPGWTKFDQVADLLSAFSERWLLVEYVPPDDPEVQEYRNRRGNPDWHWQRYFGWYDLENFKKAFGARFSKITEYPSDSPRLLFLCEK